MSFIQDQKWRYATKKYNAAKKVSSTDLETIKEAIQLAASSYGFQAYQVLLVENPAIREELKPVSWGQSQITDASHLMVFCNVNKVDDAYVDQAVSLTADTLGAPLENLKGMGDFMKSKMHEMSDSRMKEWTARQTYIALGNLLAICAELKIDSTPIEGFDPEAYDKILGLTQKGLSAAVVCAVGYRSEDDAHQNDKKVRRSTKDLFLTV